jgi:CheY-like chemotaxis protein
MVSSPENQTTILWVDDDPDDLALMHDVLNRLDSSIQIIEVHNGQQALDYLQKGKQSNFLPSLIVLDMNMPILSGRETLMLLKQDPQLHTTPTAVFTTSNSPLDKLFCERHDTLMLTKPSTTKGLAEAMQKLLSLCKKSINSMDTIFRSTNIVL